MSIAIAISKKQQVCLSTDSQTTFGAHRVSSDNHQTTKVVEYAGSYMAGTGWGKYHNILTDFTSRRRKATHLNSESAVFRFFHELWEDLHKRYSFVNDQASDKDSPFGDLDASFLIVNATGIYYVAADMSVSTFHHYYAIGSGAEYALGACYSQYDLEQSATEIGANAVAAATAFDVYCGGDLNQYTCKLKRQKR